jgi:hypothetical protein
MTVESRDVQVKCPERRSEGFCGVTNIGGDEDGQNGKEKRIRSAKADF